MFLVTGLHCGKVSTEGFLQRPEDCLVNYPAASFFDTAAGFRVFFLLAFIRSRCNLRWFLFINSPLILPKTPRKSTKRLALKGSQKCKTTWKLLPYPRSDGHQMGADRAPPGATRPPPGRPHPGLPSMRLRRPPSPRRVTRRFEIGEGPE